MRKRTEDCKRYVVQCPYCIVGALCERGVLDVLQVLRPSAHGGWDLVSMRRGLVLLWWALENICTAASPLNSDDDNLALAAGVLHMRVGGGYGVAYESGYTLLRVARGLVIS